MKLTNEELKDIVFDDGGENFVIVEESAWTIDGPDELQDIYFHKRGDQQVYCLTHSRIGSYFTDYEYDVNDGYHNGKVVPVQRVTKTIDVWEDVS
jgi:hypothetical protein